MQTFSNLMQPVKNVFLSSGQKLMWETFLNQKYNLYEVCRGKVNLTLYIPSLSPRAKNFIKIKDTCV